MLDNEEVIIHNIYDACFKCHPEKEILFWRYALMVFEKIKNIISEQLGVDEDIITMDSSFKDDLGADSLDVVELVMAVEEEFDVEFPDEDADSIVTVADAVNYINSQI